MFTDKLTKIVEPVLEGIGYELVHLEFIGRGKGATLRLYIDSENGITVDDCAKASREVSVTLDVDDPIKEPYRLEVSSPGFDRPLAKPSHFERFAGQQARIVMQQPIDGRRRFTGELRGLEGDAVAMEVDGTVVALPLQSIEKARLLPE